MAIKGSIYGLKIAGHYIPCEISCELSVTRDMIGKSGSAHGKYRRYRYGYIDWQITADARTVISSLKSSANRLLISQLEGVELDIEMTARISNTQAFDIKGKVLIPNFTLSMPNTGYSTYNVTFQGNGDLTVDAEEFWHIINAQPYDSDKPNIVDTTNW